MSVAAFAAPATALAEDPPFVGWSALLPGLATTYEPSAENDCTAGRTRCVDAVVREMKRRFRPLARSCDHDAMFALAYLRTTEEYRRTIEDPDFFEDTAFVNHEDAVFARYYFDAYDDWAAGRRSQVPAAWRIALDAADDRRVSGIGNILLGINAHIQRDLPFVLEGIGLVKPDGSSRKRDHDKVNVFLNRVQDTIIAEAARRFDPTVDDNDVPGVVDDFLKFQLVPAWREAAWRHAELLAAAPGPTGRALVAAQIESYAASQARGLRAATAYGLFSGGSRERDAYCAVNHDRG
jgi:hypothetical protein